METKNCQNCKNNFIIEPDDFSFYEKIKVPPPTFCPECRLQRRLAWFNLVNLFHRNCDLCGEKFISMYPPEAKYTVFCAPCWWSDKWSWTDYGRDYDFSRTFFEQWNELLHEAPLLGLSINSSTTVGSPYNNHANDLKDCYLTFQSSFNQECAYGTSITNSRESFNSSMIMECDTCFDCACLYRSHKVIGMRGNNRFCVDSAFLRDCENCTDCFMCANLRNKKYCYKNQQLTREEYIEIRSKYDLGSKERYQQAKREAEEFWKTLPPLPSLMVMSVNSTGSYVFNSKNCYECYDCAYCEDCKYCMSLWTAPQKNCYDVTGFGQALENAYESAVAGEFVSNIKFCQESGINLTEAEYCKICLGGNNLFGCVGVHNGEYAILNKKYSKEDYVTLVKKIKKQMDEMPYVDKRGNTFKYGEFFPLELSPFPYNITYGNLFYPKSHKEIESFGGIYLQSKQNEYKITKQANELPDHIKAVNDDILQEVLECDTCKKGFKVIEMELSFLRKMNLPIPRECPFCRINEKLNLWVDNMKLKDRVCDVCGVEFKTHYSKERSPKIFCKKCYQQEVY